VGDALLSAEDLQRFTDDIVPRDVFGLALFRPLLEVLRHHFRPMDYGQEEGRHGKSFVGASGALRQMISVGGEYAVRGVRD